jgi:cell wall-associated NlpC family hydrolase
MTESEFNLRQAVIAEAFEWLRTPFAHRQCCKGAGVDCAHFIYGVARNAGVAPELAIEEYPPDWYLHRDEERFLNWIERFCVKVDSPPYKPADIVMYRYGRTFAHAAWIVRWPQIIHAYSPAHMVTLDDALANAALQNRKREVYRYKEWE